MNIQSLLGKQKAIDATRALLQQGRTPVNLQPQMPGNGGIQLDPREWGGNGGFNDFEFNPYHKAMPNDGGFTARPPIPGGGLPPAQGSPMPISAGGASDKLRMFFLKRQMADKLRNALPINSQSNGAFMKNKMMELLAAKRGGGDNGVIHMDPREMNGGFDNIPPKPGMISLDPREWGGNGGFDNGVIHMDPREMNGGFNKPSPGPGQFGPGMKLDPKIWDGKFNEANRQKMMNLDRMSGDKFAYSAVPGAVPGGPGGTPPKPPGMQKPPGLTPMPGSPRSRELPRPKPGIGIPRVWQKS